MATDEFIEKIFNDVIRFKPIEHKDNIVIEFGKYFDK